MGQVIPDKDYFLELASEEADRTCVDGRVDKGKRNGFQMLGGSLHPVALKAIYRGENITVKFIEDNFRALKAQGIKIGLHRGSHRSVDENKSDCGFADNLDRIIAKVKEEKKEIKARLEGLRRMALSQGVKNLELELSGEEFTQRLEMVINQIASYDPEKVKIKGEELVAALEGLTDKKGKPLVDSVQDLKGDHQEGVVFVNLEPGVSFNTVEANEQGWQAFNLDLREVEYEAKSLGINDLFFIHWGSLVFYVATEIVLVEDRGKEPLPVRLHI